MRLGIVFGALGIGLAACALALVPLALGKRNRATLPPLFDGTTVVYAVPFAGGRPHEVLRLHGQWEFPVATADGQALLLERPTLTGTGVWRVPLDGSRPTHVRELPVFKAPATGAGRAPVSTRDGRSLLYYDTSNRLVVRDSVTGSLRVLVPAGRYFEASLSRDGRTVYFLGTNDAVSIPK
jgi:hypothetical protein